MVEFKSNYSFAGLLLVLSLVVGGLTYNIVPTGNYKVCDNGVGWSLNNNDGYCYCGDRKYDCSSIRNTKTGKPNYFCDEATRVEVKEVVKLVETQTQVTCPVVNVIKYDYDGTKWLCNENGANCVKWSELMDYQVR